MQGRLSDLLIARQAQQGLSTSSKASRLPAFYKRVTPPCLCVDVRGCTSPGEDVACPRPQAWKPLSV